MTHTNDEKVGKGALRNDQDRLVFEEGFSFSGYERDPLYMNLGPKRKFMDVSGVSGIDSITDGRAGVFADFDNDGDTDVFMTTIQGEAHLLFRNNVGQSSNYLRVALEGDRATGRDAFGAVVRVRTSQGTLTKVKSGGSGFISQHDPRLLFGLGKDARAEALEVTWPGGAVERFEGEAAAGSTVLLRKGAGRAEVLPVGRAQLPDPLTRDQAFARGLKVAVGAPLPDVAVRTVAGASTSLRKQLRPGRKTLVNVWATWCVPCAAEMPELERLSPQLAARGVDLLGLSVDTDPKADLRGFLAARKVRYPVVAGGAAAAEALYSTDEMAVPMSVLVDERGVVLEIIAGWSGRTQARLRSLAGAEPSR